jgi:hypothetical protein
MSGLAPHRVRAKAHRVRIRRVLIVIWSARIAGPIKVPDLSIHLGTSTVIAISIAEVDGLNCVTAIGGAPATESVSAAAITTDGDQALAFISAMAGIMANVAGLSAGR